MATATDSGPPASEIIHRRETFRYIVLPMIGLLALIGMGVGATLLLPKPAQVALVADWLVSAFFLCPAVLCLFPIVLLLVAAVAGMVKLHASTLPPLRKLQLLTSTLSIRTVQLTDSINSKTANASVRLAFVDRLLSIFDPPATPPANGEKEE